ncbi:unnamed protein product [Medioppia subpectinata]|uniref:TGF-beta family profile domain-containing protein n=1 Tax=Medioppia subpectinata TaxID=1979941 RepID=A0A7R9Q7T9_9ACAR|nr:unnamed protein product [Medioppia subpectinata]CAG2115159.1 unnamed protein product [Medioppia subpectinata]
MNEIRFANRYRNHMNKQPMIVVFTSDNKHNFSNKPKESNSKYGFSVLNDESFDGNEFRELNPSLESSLKETNESLIVSDSMPSIGGSSHVPNVCNGRQISIDFESIGWSSSIIFPKGFTTYLCEGKCVKRTDKRSSTKSDTSLTSVGHLRPFYSMTDRRRIKKRSEDTLCCIANELNALDVLYFDDRGNVVLKRIDDLLVGSCGCQSSSLQPLP